MALFQALDPVRLLQQLHALQDALWQHAVVSTPATTTTTTPDSLALSTTPAHLGAVSFNVQGCGLPLPLLAAADNGVGSNATNDGATSSSSISELAALLEGHGRDGSHTRTYRRTKLHIVRTWRTRADPFASIWGEVCQRLEAAPERTAKAIFQELQQQYPGQYADGQLRTLQRRVKQWRAQAILQFDQGWLEDELLPAQVLPADLTARTAGMADRAVALRYDLS